MKMSPLVVLAAVGAMAALPGDLAGQVAYPPSGGVLNRFLAPPSGLEQQFLGTWNLAWDDPADPNCPCHGTLTIEVVQDGLLKGFWSVRNPPVVLHGDVAFDQNMWAGTYAQPDGVDFPLKGHFRLEARGGKELTGSYHRDGTTIPYRWNAIRR